jgi:hypothetical protein
LASDRTPGHEARQHQVGRAAEPFHADGHSRFTRLTNAFSKKGGNYIYALAIYFMHYNYVRIHQTLSFTPAMADGVSKTPGRWTMWSR